jgi:hypothetical protein
MHMTVFWPIIIMWNISKNRFFDSLLKPFVHWSLLHPDTNFLDTLVHRQKVKRIPHLIIVTITVVAIGTTFCCADGIGIKKIRTLFLVHRKLKFLCRVCSVIVHPERKPVLFRKLKRLSISKNATKPNPFEIILVQITRKKNNWKTEETLEKAVVTSETERIKGSNPWCL